MSKDLPEKIADLDKVQFRNIDVSFINNSNNKQSKLINNEDDEFTYKLYNKEYIFNFNEPLFIESILIRSDSKHLKDMEIEVKDYFLNESVSISSIKIESPDCIKILINRVVNSFQLIPPYTFFNKIYLESIKINGIELSEFSTVNQIYKESKELESEVSLYFNESNQEIEHKYTELDKRENIVNQKIEASKIELNEISETINDKSDRLIELKSSIKTEEQTLEKLNEKNVELKNVEKNLTKNNTDLKNNIQQQEQKTSELNQQISDLKAEIEKHTNDKNLFAYELKDFVKEGSSSVWKYLWIAFIPMILIAVLTIIVFNGTVDLTTKYSEDGFDIMTVFWSRLPFAIIITSIILVCYEITKIFLTNVIEIQNQKLNFSKIGIISKDIATNSFEGLDLNDNEKFELRTKIKMHLIRSYLAKEFRISRDYNINKSLWSRYKEWRKGKKTRNQEGTSLDNVESTELENIDDENEDVL